MTAMAGVCFYNHVDCLKVLLSFNASPLVVDRHGVSPLQVRSLPLPLPPLLFFILIILF